MHAVWTPIRKALRFVFMPEIKPHRVLREGLVRGNFALWLATSAVLLLLAFGLTGSSFELYLPQYLEWRWVEVTVIRLPVWLWLVFWLLATGLCFYPRNTAIGVAVVFALYYVYAAANGSAIQVPFAGQDTITLPHLPIYAYHYFLPLFVAFSAVLTFIYYPARQKSPQDRLSAADVVLSLITLAATVDFIWNFSERGERAGLVHWNDVIFGTVMAIVSIEMCRRVLGLMLPLLGVLFLLYTWLGQYFPSAIAHRGFPYNEVTAYLYSDSGIYGTIANVFASYVFLFIVFGAILQMTKVGDVFIDLAFSLVGRFKGGAAKASTVSSALVGSIVGSGAANIVITGTFTIPLMKRSGYSPHYAAGVEATASIGGQLMPPIMGSAAFIVAAFTEVSYPYIALVSIVPALMYYFSVYMSVHYRACREGIEGLPREELPDFVTIVRKDGYRLLPVVLLIFLLVIGFSPFFAAFWSIVTALVVCCFREDSRLLQLPAPLAALVGWGGTPAPAKGETIPSGPAARYGGLAAGAALLVALPALFDMSISSALFFAVCATILFSSPRMIATLTQGSINSLVVGTTAGIMGIVLAGVTMPGLALRFPAIVLEYAGGSLPMAIVLCAIASYVLGMGMTITAAYVVLALLAVPALMALGVPELNAHLMILWLSQDSSLTPPFALGAFIAAGIAQADPTRTGFASVILAKPLYVVPFMMAYSPILMDPGSAWWDILLVWAAGFVGFFCMAVAFEGYFRRILAWWERSLFASAALLFFFHVWWLNIAALLVLALSVAVQTHRRSGRSAPSPIPELRKPQEAP
jgi:TRAP transporter 4TM/12TM fusion protein